MKVFARYVYNFADCLTVSFGTEKDLEDWDTQKKQWEAEGLNCEKDHVKEIGSTDNFEKLLQAINRAASGTQVVGWRKA